MTIKKEGDNLVITIPMNAKPFPDSKSGKTKLVASSGGNKETDLKIDGKAVTVGLNVFIK